MELDGSGGWDFFFSFYVSYASDTRVNSRISGNDQNGRVCRKERFIMNADKKEVVIFE